MKKSNNMTNMGSNIHGQKMSKKDITRKQQAYFKKVDDFGAMELKSLNSLKKTKKIKGIYAEALDDVIAQKEQELEQASVEAK